MQTRKKFYKRKGFIALLIVVVLLVAFRLYLPTLVKNYVNGVLSDIPGYYGYVEDIDLAIYRGAYVINGLYLNKVKAETQIPFLNFPKTDISIQWNAIFRGKIVSEIYMYDPEINYVMEDQQASGDTAKPKADDWTEALDDLIPIDINHFEINNGTVAFKQVNARPPIDLHITEINLVAENLQMVKGKEHTLPSTLTATGNSIGGGHMTIDGRVNLIKEIPDADISFKLEKVDMTALNDFAQEYAKLDFKQGEFNFYSEFAIADGYLKGYLKPLMTKVELIEKEEPFLTKVWEGIVEFFGFIIKNQKTKTLATKVPLEGDLNNPDTEIWPAIGAIFRNAWIEAFRRTIDDEIEYKDAIKGDKTQKKE